MPFPTSLLAKPGFVASRQIPRRSLLPSFRSVRALVYNLTTMPLRLTFSRTALLASTLLLALSLSPAIAQKTSSSLGRTLLVPHTIVSGERATLAVLDSRGRLAPGVNVIFSNGDHFTTDATGRAVFAAPLNAGVILASIEGSSTRIPVVIIPPSEAAADSILLDSVPQLVSLTDRFDVTGRGFCGVADANQIAVSGANAFVLASSPMSLTIWPPPDLPPGRASLTISCGKQTSSAFDVAFVSLELEADSSPLKPGVHRTLRVLVHGTSESVELQAKNLAPAVAEIVGGNNRKVSSSGGAQNVAELEILGRAAGNFQISIRLVSPAVKPR